MVGLGWWLSALAGCRGGCPPLARAPVTGDGTPAEVSAIEDELRGLAGTLALPVCVDHVRVGPVHPEERTGEFHDWRRAVQVEGGRPLDEVRRTVRHEVCHAVDDQNGIVAGRPEAFPHLSPRDARGWEEHTEAFAELCELGADALSVLWDADCPDDPDLRGARIVRDEVYGVASDPDPVDRYEPIASFTAPWVSGAGPRMVLHSFFTPDRLGIDLIDDAGVFTTFDVDPWTGEPFEDASMRFGIVPTEVFPPDPWTTNGAWWGELGGERWVVSASLSLPTGAVTRAHVLDADGTWRPAREACEPGDARVHFFGEPWSATLDGDTIAWGRWVGE